MLTGSGEVYTCGDGTNGKTGHSDMVHEELKRFRLVERLKSENTSQIEGFPARIVVGRDSSAVVTQEGHLYTWGTGEDGKLGAYIHNAFFF